MFNRAITIFLGKDNCHYTTKEKQTGTATLDDKSQVQFLSKKNPKMPFFYSRRNLYMIGFLLAFIVTLLEFIRGRHQNFMVFSDATQFFWQGISPYTTEFVEAHGRYFLYSPVFTVLFAPFAYLPAWLGPFAWNLFNYSLFFMAIFTLPQQFTQQQKCRMFLFLLLILGQSLLSFQYNITVAYLFLFAYTLLEKDRGFLAVLLIMISGCTKVYGIFELALLLCYPHVWRNFGYAVTMGIVLLALPLIKIAPADLLPYYEEWCHSLAVYQSAGAYDSFFYARPIAAWTLPHFRALQIGMLGLLTLLFLGNFRKWSSFAFRAQALGILMGWVVLLSDSAEKHTYIIALAGFMLWYLEQTNTYRNRQDSILVLFCAVMYRSYRHISPYTHQRFHYQDLMASCMGFLYCMDTDDMAYLPCILHSSTCHKCSFRLTHPLALKETSSASKSCFCSTQPGTSLPVEFTTLWQGMDNSSGTSFNARPTIREHWGAPNSKAIPP